MKLGKGTEDIRVETNGQWTRGMCVVDRRGRLPGETADPGAVAVEHGGEELSLDEVPGDTGNWLRAGLGNGVWRCVESEWKDTFGDEMLKRIYGI
jgi:hypothetical protein